jgi:hypothetical protein
MCKQRPSKGSSPARATSRSRNDAPPRSSGDGSSSGTRRLVLGGAVMVLLLALAFTAGVGVGRSKRPAAAPEPALAAVKPADRWGIRGRSLPLLAPTKLDNLKSRMIEDFVRRWPHLADQLDVQDNKDKNNKPLGTFRLVVRGFDTRDDAMAEAENLTLWVIDGQMPFRDSRPERMPDLPSPR